MLYLRNSPERNIRNGSFEVVWGLASGNLTVCYGSHGPYISMNYLRQMQFTRELLPVNLPRHLPFKKHKKKKQPCLKMLWDSFPMPYINHPLRMIDSKSQCCTSSSPRYPLERDISPERASEKVTGCRCAQMQNMRDDTVCI